MPWNDESWRLCLYSLEASPSQAPGLTPKRLRDPYPTDQADWRKKCGWLRREIARQQNIASSGTTQPGTFSYEDPGNRSKQRCHARLTHE